MFATAQRLTVFLLMLISVLVLPLPAKGTENPVIVRQAAVDAPLASDHQMVRTSTGRIYYFTGNAGHTSTWDGWIEVSTSLDGTSWTALDNRDEWHASSSIAAAVDSRNYVHLLTYDWNNRPAYNMFFTEDGPGGNNSWGGAEPLESAKAAINGRSAITIDANDIPHLVYMLQETYKGKSYTTLTYANRIGGVWNRVVIWPKEGKVSFAGKIDIVIGPDNIPHILAGNKVFRGNANSATAFETKDLGAPCYSMVLHDNGDVRLALSLGGNYANYLHDHTHPWASGWNLSASITPDSSGILILANDQPYLARLMADGIWLQKEFEAPRLAASQPTGIAWQSLTSRWSRFNLHQPGIIDLGTRSWSSQSGNQYWYASISTPTAADFSAAPVQGIAPLLVNFTDKSLPQEGRFVTSWEWDFNNDGLADAVTANPAHRFDSAGTYSVQLKVTDSQGGQAVKTKPGFITVGGDGDGDGIADNLDNCPNDYNPLQIDINNNGIGDTCEAPVNLVQTVNYMTGLRTTTSADRNIQNVTAIMTDRQLSQGVTISAQNKSAVSVQVNKDARTIKKLVLRMYLSGINYNPYNSAVAIMPYNSDLKTTRSWMSGGWDGWNELDLTPIIHQMDGYGVVKFRIAALNQQDFDMYEISLREPYDNKEITATPETVDFGVIESAKSSTATVRISNNGSESLDIIRVRPPSSPFTLGTEECSGKTLGSGSFCELSLLFSPSYNSSFSDILRIDSTDADRSSLRINLQGSGTFVLNGTVRDATTGYSMSGVTVKVTDSQRTTTVVTDTSGNYSISGMPLGDYTTSFTRSDYQPLTLTGFIRQGESNRLDASLSYNYATISGVVTDQTSNAPISGVAVTLNLTGIQSKNPADLVYACTPISNTLDTSRLNENDGLKTVCGGPGSGYKSSMTMKARNPFGIDPFTVTWNGIAALAGDTPEYLAQGFKPSKSGKLTRASFFLDGVYESVGGYVYVLLKNRLGGDRGSFLAISNRIGVKTAVGVSKWVDFDFATPADVNAGQEYYLEINGTFFNWIGSSGYLFDLPWRNAASYPDSNGYARNNGIWNQSNLPLAFRTYVDGQANTSAQEGTSNIRMSGGNTANFYTENSLPLPSNWDRLALDNDGEYGWNGDDLTASGTYSDNLIQYYDASGWIQATVNGSAHVSSALATDQFTISFNRSLTAVTDASGAYSFPALPESDYTLAFSKTAYTGATASGRITTDQDLRADQTMILAPPATIQGTITSSSNNIPAAGVTITVTDPLGTKIAVSDSQGKYLISDIVYGNYSMTLSGAQLQTKTMTGTISAGKNLAINVSMNPLPITLTIASPANNEIVAANPMTITGNAPGADTVTISMYEYDTENEASYPATITNGTYSATVPLAAGETWIQVGATNKYGLSAWESIAVTRAAFTVKNLGDTGNVAVMEVSGDYNAKAPDGSLNDQPRKAVAAEYFKSHGDVDFLVYLSTFDYTMPEAGAKGFYNPVKNDTMGINQPLLDNTSQYGSAGSLQGVIDLGNVTQLASNPYGPKLDETITTLSHELVHRFGAYVRFKNPDGTLNTALLGKDNAHWSYLLDSKGSLMYGSAWTDKQDGSYTATGAMSGFSPLDLYLMGMIPKEQVPPLTLIENAAEDRNRIPQLGATVTGTARTITIDDIIAAEGERVPNAAASQKLFKVGFVLLVKPGENPATAAAAVETLRSAWAGRFAELTQGKGSIAGVAPGLTLTIDTPADNATITGPDVTVTGTVINSTGAETGITVNGIPATVSGSRFIVNHVPLQEGGSTLTITATDAGAGGLTTTATRSVTAQAGHYIRIIPNIESGTGPLDISLRLDGSFTVANPTVSIVGPVPVSPTPGTSPTKFTARLNVQGSYTITASATGPDGEAYSNSLTITVLSKEYMDVLLQSRWNGMKSAMAASDISGALSFVSEPARKKYQPVFQALYSHLPDITANMGPIAHDYIRNDVSEYRISRTETFNAQQREVTYFIYFSLDKNGLWKIDQM